MFGLDRVGFKMGRIEFGSIWVSSGQFGSVEIGSVRVSLGQFGSVRVSSGQFRSVEIRSIRVSTLFFFFKNPIGYSDRVGFDPNRSQPDRVCKFQTDRVSIPTRTRNLSGRVKCPPLDGRPRYFSCLETMLSRKMFPIAVA